VICLATVAVAFAAIQLVPYGRVRSNPPVTGSPAWDAPVTQELFARACADCHSNETRWPWYGYVAPASWLVRSDVDEARAKFNVSEWGRPRRNEGHEAADNVESGEMPLRAYLWMHPEARLDPEERRALVAGLVATFGEERRKR
jgi:mono/diheme cytochrome c family protein